MSKRFTSRSAVLCANVCPYKRFLTYHAMGTGLVPEYESLDLIIGTCVHRGIQHLLEHCRKHTIDEQLTEACINEAVEKAYEVWNEILQNKQLALHSGEDERLPWILAEQENLFEGLIRIFAIRRLPPILEEYIILEVEKEEVFENFSDLVTFLGKADGLFLRKADNKIIQLSIKTASTYPEVTERNILHDMQGVSEQVCTNDRLNSYLEDMASYFHCQSIDPYIIAISEQDKDLLIAKYGSIICKLIFTHLKNKTTPKVYAVQYEFLLKGQRKQDPWLSGIYKQQNFLLHPYKQESLMTIGKGQIGFSPSEYKWTWGKGRQPKGWDKIDIWEDIGIKNWVDMLASGAIQPEEGNALDTLLITPSLILRTDEEIKEWKVSTRFQEEEIAKHLDEIENLQQTYLLDYDDDRANKLQEAIWKYFPKNTLSCHNYYSRDCSYVKHCHEFLTLEMATDAGLFIKRLPHHDLEMKSFKEKGLINE